MLVRARRCARWLTEPEPCAAAPTDAWMTSSGVRPAFPCQLCHRHSEEEMGGRRSRGGRRKRKRKEKGKKRKEEGVVVADGLGLSPALPGVGWPPVIGPVPAAASSHPFFLSFLFFFFSFPFSSFSPASSSSRLLFTATVARPAGEGRPNPTGRRPNTGRCRCPRLGLGKPAGTPPSPNQHAGAGLAPVLGEGLQRPCPLPPPLRHYYTLPPFSPTADQWRGINAGGGGASAGPSSLFPSLPLSLSLIPMVEGIYLVDGEMRRRWPKAERR